MATLVLTVTPKLHTTNITICDNQLPYSWNNLTFTSAGTQVDTLTSVAGCDSLATLVLTVTPTVTSTTNITICDNQLPYSWNNLTFTSAGTQVDTLTSVAGCDSLATLNLSIIPILNLSVQVDSVLCFWRFFRFY